MERRRFDGPHEPHRPRDDESAWECAPTDEELRQMPLWRGLEFDPHRRAAPAARVRFAGKLTAADCPGGGERQMHATAAALLSRGLDVRAWRPWEDDFEDCEILHLFGSEPAHLPLIHAAKRRGVKTALSPIAWFDLGSLWREPGGAWAKLAACGKFLARSWAPRCPSWRRELYHLADVLLPNSKAEADQLRRYFQVPAKRIRVVPNAADERFALADGDEFVARCGVRDFILYVGRIEPRKNQLGFLRAMQGSDLPIVFVGGVVPGHEDYAAKCRKLAGSNATFVGPWAPDDPLLASAYAACRCLALVSWFETPGLAALEASLTGTPLVLTDRGSAREYLGDLADYVAPHDQRAIRRAVLAAYDRPRNPRLARLAREYFTWRTTAEFTHAAYAQLH